MRIGEKITGREKNRDRQHRRNQKEREAVLVASVPEQGQRNHERSNRRASLIERFVQTEDPAAPDLVPSKRKHCFRGRLSDRAPSSFRHDESRGERPVPGERKRRDREHVDDVADDRDDPVLPRLVGNDSRHRTQRVADQFSKPGGESDDGRTGAESSEKRASDAARAFIRHIREEVPDADDENEPKRSRGGKRCPLLFHDATRY